MRIRVPLLAAVGAAALLASCAHPVPDTHLARVPAEERSIPWTGDMPQCDEPAVHARIARHFKKREKRFWETGLEIKGIDQVRPVALRPLGVDLIPRRFCTGRAWLSDGRYRQIHYSVIEQGGVIGKWWGVEWCVVGLDRHGSFAPSCKMAQP